MMIYPETKRYPELFEKLNTNSICFKINCFYVFFNGIIAYYNGRGWWKRQEDGTWKKDYTLERWADDAAYGIAIISDDIAAEYGFTAP